MNLSGLWTLQVFMFFTAIAGIILKKKGVLRDEAKPVITDLTLDFLLPCSIINSFKIEVDGTIYMRLTIALAVAFAIQGIGYALSKVLFKKTPSEIRRVMRYCTIVSNSGFLGLPVISGIYGQTGLMIASVFIVPTRIMMWSAGISCFTESPGLKTVLKKIATHPCVIAVYIGMVFLIFGKQINAMNEALYAIPVAGTLFNVLISALNKMLASAGSCVTPMIMILIGMMLADVSPKEMLDRNAAYITALRLVILPFIALVLCKVLHVDHLITCIAVLITGMPAGSTSAILAAKYDCNYYFATKCIVVSTLLSIVSIPIWAMILG